MLVLLIIVILIAPMLQNRVQVALPEAENTNDKPDTSDQTVVHVDSDSRLYVNGTAYASQQDCITRLKDLMETVKDHTVYLKGDKNAPYGAIMSMMDALRKAGIETVGLITEKRGGDAPAKEKGGN